MKRREQESCSCDEISGPLCDTRFGQALKTLVPAEVLEMSALHCILSNQCFVNTHVLFELSNFLQP